MGTQCAEKIMRLCGLAGVIPKEGVPRVVGKEADTQDEGDQKEDNAPYFLPDRLCLSVGLFLLFFLAQ